MKKQITQYELDLNNPPPLKKRQAGDKPRKAQARFYRGKAGF